ncbi:PREDICTED: probable JmjC domain-containing histone demethylation protein 2C isoform X1 [Branchiostoma belcheri]|uniref:[histone H3]-dimethyl-L-lysine(9) demethylase n=2 Tax=Branchiostoma belcheri TaxID=7741 RepID=A0A6P4ZXE1_BRABE|nr:PREDICTED: probable JmjC domain-containing histone demethylation protein 2C isoform X1 [Branchiostoma belcheri]
MMMEERKELVGKRFLCVSGGGKLKFSRISEWEWKSGVIRAVSHKPEDQKHPDFSVYVEFDDRDWEQREWLKVYEGGFQVFLVEKTLVWGQRRGISKSAVLWPALTFSYLVDKVSLGQGGRCVLEFLHDRARDFVQHEETRPYQEEDDSLQPALKDYPHVRAEIKDWVKEQKVQDILLRAPYSLTGYRVKVYRLDSATQWFTAVISAHNPLSRELTVMNDTVLETHEVDPALVQMTFLDDVLESLLKGENVGITPRRRSCTQTTTSTASQNSGNPHYTRTRSSQPSAVVSTPSTRQVEPSKIRKPRRKGSDSSLPPDLDLDKQEKTEKTVTAESSSRQRNPMTKMRKRKSSESMDTEEKKPDSPQKRARSQSISDDRTMDQSQAQPEVTDRGQKPKASVGEKGRTKSRPRPPPKKKKEPEKVESNTGSETEVEVDSAKCMNSETDLVATSPVQKDVKNQGPAIEESNPRVNNPTEGKLNKSQRKEVEEVIESTVKISEGTKTHEQPRTYAEKRLQINEDTRLFDEPRIQGEPRKAEDLRLHEKQTRKDEPIKGEDRRHRGDVTNWEEMKLQAEFSKRQEEQKLLQERLPTPSAQQALESMCQEFPVPTVSNRQKIMLPTNSSSNKAPPVTTANPTKEEGERRGFHPVIPKTKLDSQKSPLVVDKNEEVRVWRDPSLEKSKDVEVTHISSIQHQHLVHNQSRGFSHPGSATSHPHGPQATSHGSAAAHSHLPSSTHPHPPSSSHPHVPSPAHPHVQSPAHPHVPSPAHPHVPSPAHPHVPSPAHPHVPSPAHPHVPSPAHPHVPSPANPHVPSPAHPHAQSPAHAHPSLQHSPHSSVTPNPSHTDIGRLQQQQQQQLAAMLAHPYYQAYLMANPSTLAHHLLRNPNGIPSIHLDHPYAAKNLAIMAQQQQQLQQMGLPGISHQALLAQHPQLQGLSPVQLQMAWQHTYAQQPWLRQTPADFERERERLIRETQQRCPSASAVLHKPYPDPLRPQPSKPSCVSVTPPGNFHGQPARPQPTTAKGPEHDRAPNPPQQRQQHDSLVMPRPASAVADASRKLYGMHPSSTTATTSSSLFPARSEGLSLRAESLNRLERRPSGTSVKLESSSTPCAFQHTSAFKATKSAFNYDPVLPPGYRPFPHSTGMSPSITSSVIHSSAAGGTSSHGSQAQDTRTGPEQKAEVQDEESSAQDKVSTRRPQLEQQAPLPPVPPLVKRLSGSAQLEKPQAVVKSGSPPSRDPHSTPVVQHFVSHGPWSHSSSLAASHKEEGGKGTFGCPPPLTNPRPVSTSATSSKTQKMTVAIQTNDDLGLNIASAHQLSNAMMQPLGGTQSTSHPGSTPTSSSFSQQNTDHQAPSSTSIPRTGYGSTSYPISHLSVIVSQPSVIVQNPVGEAKASDSSSSPKKRNNPHTNHPTTKKQRARVGKSQLFPAASSGSHEPMNLNAFEARSPFEEQFKSFIAQTSPPAASKSAGSHSVSAMLMADKVKLERPEGTSVIMSPSGEMIRTQSTVDHSRRIIAKMQQFESRVNAAPKGHIPNGTSGSDSDSSNSNLSPNKSGHHKIKKAWLERHSGEDSNNSRSPEDGDRGKDIANSGEKTQTLCSRINEVIRQCYINMAESPVKGVLGKKLNPSDSITRSLDFEQQNGNVEKWSLQENRRKQDLSNMAMKQEMSAEAQTLREEHGAEDTGTTNGENPTAEKNKHKLRKKNASISYLKKHRGQASSPDRKCFGKKSRQDPRCCHKPKPCGCTPEQQAESAKKMWEQGKGKEDSRNRFEDGDEDGETSTKKKPNGQIKKRKSDVKDEGTSEEPVKKKRGRKKKIKEEPAELPEENRKAEKSTSASVTTANNKKQEVACLLTMSQAHQKYSKSKLMKLGLSFTQDGPCSDVTPKLMKCRECRMSAAQKIKKGMNIFCRFYAFRRLKYSQKGFLMVGGFCDPDDCGKSDMDLWIPHWKDVEPALRADEAKYIITLVGDKFCELVTSEQVAKNWGTNDAKPAWKRAVTGVRELCDQCDTTLFNIHWVCEKCGFVVCLDCFRARKNTPLTDDELDDDDPWLECIKHQHHRPENLMLTQIIPGTALDDLRELIHEVRDKWSIKSNCLCLGKKRSSVGQNGISQLLWNAALEMDAKRERRERGLDGKLTSSLPSSTLHGDKDSRPAVSTDGDANPSSTSGSRPTQETAKSSAPAAPAFGLHTLADVANMQCKLNAGESREGDMEVDFNTSFEKGSTKAFQNSKSTDDDSSTDRTSKSPLNRESGGSGKDTKELSNEAIGCKTLRELLTQKAESCDLGKKANAFVPVGGQKRSRLITSTLDEIISTVVEQSIPMVHSPAVRKGTSMHQTPVYDAVIPSVDEPVPRHTLTETSVWFPDVPHSWLCEGRLLRLHDPKNPNNLKLFQEQWKRGMPVLVSGVNKYLNSNIWRPEAFSREFGELENDLVNCRNGNVIPNIAMKKFWDGFEDIPKRLKDEETNDTMLLKLKDWPPGEDFSEMLPRRFQDLMQALPLPEYTRRTGKLNLASRLPDFFVRPDLGPKMYNAYGSAAHPSEGTTNLHLDISDAVNVMVYVGIPNSDDEGNSSIDYEREALKAIDEADCDDIMRRRVRETAEKPGALWHIYAAKDAQKIRDFLIKVGEEQGEDSPEDHDPIHDQSWYLDSALRKRLYQEYGVEGWTIVQCLGDAVFIPGGAPHQVRNLHSCIKVAEDFVSPEHVSHCFRLTQEFRKLSDTHTNHEDKLQIKNIIYHAIKDSVSCLKYYEENVPLDSLSVSQ